MSVSVLLLSLVFALIEAGLSWLVLCFAPVAAIFANAPLWVVTGTIFAVGMLITFIVIFMVGSMNLTDRAGSFVRDHFGRSVALAALSIIVVLVVSIGGEMLYQATPIPRHQKKKNKADICYVLDYSYSMDDPCVGSNVKCHEALKDAFAEAMDGMTDEQRVCVIRYDDKASVLYDWETVTDDVRNSVVAAVRNEQPSGTTDFEVAIRLAGEQVDKAVADNRSVAVVMISDGYGSFSSVQKIAPTFIDNSVQIHTIGIGEDSDAVTLQRMSDETGGQFLASASDVAGITTAMVDATEQAANSGGTDDTSVVDTLLTERWVNRKTIINARVLRILILFLMGFWFKFIAIICIGNNDSSPVTHFLHAFFVSILAALLVEFGYSMGLPVIAVLAGFWVLMITQIVRTDR